MAFLIGVGCWTLNVVANRVQGNECGARGSRCALHDQQIKLSQTQQNESGWIGEYLKGTRSWRDTVVMTGDVNRSGSAR